MNRTVLPQPPNPANYSSDDWQRAVYAWMNKVKSQIETDSAANITPAAPFVVGSYTPVNTIVGTDATSNFVATLVVGLQNKGITSPAVGGAG